MLRIKVGYFFFTVLVLQAMHKICDSRHVHMQGVLMHGLSSARYTPLMLENKTQ